MQIIYLILGVAALAFGGLTIYLRVKRPEKLWKLKAMIERWGEVPGKTIHIVAYSLLPIWVGLVLVFAGIGISLPSGTQQAELNQILDVFNAGDLDASRTQLEAFLAKHPEHEIALILLGHVNYDQGKLEAAEQSYQRAITASGGKSFRAHNAIAILYEAGNQLERAETHYNKSIELNPKYAHAYSGLAVVKLKNSEDEAALKLAQKAYTLNKKDAVIASNLAVAYHYNQNVTERDKMVKRAAELGYANVKDLQQIFSGELTIRPSAP